MDHPLVVTYKILEPILLSAQIVTRVRWAVALPQHPTDRGNPARSAYTSRIGSRQLPGNTLMPLRSWCSTGAPRPSWSITNSESEWIRRRGIRNPLALRSNYTSPSTGVDRGGFRLCIDRPAAEPLQRDTTSMIVSCESRTP